jgi:hypothetical protein
VGIVTSLEVVSRDTAWFAAWPACCSWLLWSAGTRLSSGMRQGGSLPHDTNAALLLVIGGLHSVVARPLAASLGAWYFLAISGAVWDIVEGRRSRQRQPGRTWPAVDCGGASSMAGSSRCGTTSQDSAGDIFDPLARWRWFGQGGSSVRTSNHGGGLQLVLIYGGGAPLRATLTTILETTPERGAVRRV